MIMRISLETIRSRVSVRTYDGAPLSPAAAVALHEACRSCGPGPFGNRPRFALVGPELEGTSGSGRVGTYGAIRKAPAYILGVIARGPFAFEDYGYCLQGLVLEATALGLGTCWLGGIFDRKAAVRALRAAPNEIVPAMTPVGTAASRRGLIDTAIRGSAKAASRKPWEELFFADGFDTPLSHREDPWSVVLECVRLGPSASNKQPWRIVRDGEPDTPRFHLYLREDKKYNHLMGEIRLQNIDMGIAMCQFETAAKILNLPGAWTRLKPEPLAAEDPMSYIASFLAGRTGG